MTAADAAMLAVCALFLVAAGARLVRSWSEADRERVCALVFLLVFAALQLVVTYLLARPCGEAGLPFSERYSECGR